jgi:hypothetical protein
VAGAHGLVLMSNAARPRNIFGMGSAVYCHATSLFSKLICLDFDQWKKFLMDHVHRHRCNGLSDLPGFFGPG